MLWQFHMFIINMPVLCTKFKRYGIFQCGSPFCNNLNFWLNHQRPDEVASGVASGLQDTSWLSPSWSIGAILKMKCQSFHWQLPSVFTVVVFHFFLEVCPLVFCLYHIGRVFPPPTILCKLSWNLFRDKNYSAYLSLQIRSNHHKSKDNPIINSKKEEINLKIYSNA